jgi:RND family efflux transporter MFP subunit
MSELKTVASNENTEERLRAEIEELKRRLEERHHGSASGRRHRPSATTLFVLAALAVVALVSAFFLGYLPQSSRQTALAKEAQESGLADPLVNVAVVQRSSSKSELVLPGSIQAVTEAPILARASGYIAKRYADIGDRVKEGDLLAEIEAPELVQQVRQAKAGLDQASSGLEQATANLQQGKTNADMARITAERWGSLVQKGAVARQDADTYQSQYDAQRSNVQALEKAVNVAKSNVNVAEANLGRLTEMQGYLKVRAPFAGVITLRNVDTGALVNDGSTLMFRIAQTERLRTYVNVPQADATSVHVGQAANLKIPDLPSKSFIGTVTRTANSLDPSTRTLLAEVQVPNESGQLLPGMYAEVNFTTPRAEPPLVIRGDTLVVRADGPQVAILGPGERVHFQHVQLGRDYGDRVEVLAGLEEGQRLVINPGDSVRENTKVKAAATETK